MHGPRVPVWLDRMEDWPAGHPGAAEEEVCTQSSFILLRSTTSEVQGSLTLRQAELELLFAEYLSVASFSPYPRFPSLLCTLQTPLPLCLVHPPLLRLLVIRLYPHLQNEWRAKLGSLLPPAVDVLRPPCPHPCSFKHTQVKYTSI